MKKIKMPYKGYSADERAAMACNDLPLDDDAEWEAHKKAVKAKEAARVAALHAAKNNS
jgi:hypothetical protein